MVNLLGALNGGMFHVVFDQNKPYLRKKNFLRCPVLIKTVWLLVDFSSHQRSKKLLASPLCSTYKYIYKNLFTYQFVIQYI